MRSNLKKKTSSYRNQRPDGREEGATCFACSNLYGSFYCCIVCMYVYWYVILAFVTTDLCSVFIRAPRQNLSNRHYILQHVIPSSQSLRLILPSIFTRAS